MASPAKKSKVDREYFCVDRILPKDLHRMQPQGNPAGAILVKSKKWLPGTVLHVRYMGGSAEERKKAEEEALWWVPLINIPIKFDNAPDAQIRISFTQDGTAWSYVGTDCLGIPLDQPTMNLGFHLRQPGTAAHEFGHALGLGHEHQNPAGGMQWNVDAVVESLSGAPNFWDREKIQHNVLDKYSVDQIFGTAFDPQSIMLYAFPASWTRNGVATSSNAVLSDLDKQFISSMYPPTQNPLASEVKLVVDARKPTTANIGTAGEEDTYTFTVTNAGTHVIETGGQSDTILKLFGPNSRTSLIYSDDDSGSGYNARISAPLRVGTYYVSVHLYSPSSVGSYSISVKRR